ncbi:metallophosphoesterase [Anaerovorax odorimutans]|uniref:Metallophosphoesterase n=1 Tax=Anaerovorax odorimutans TaxID=109327 RepID=A0ABT1RM88_9FIRM|nr:metallophosphoesterase [Anaerovorax odorimutans]MCQ4636287.1 metallophosphoesterase [Anaerovorax odorimutans]
MDVLFFIALIIVYLGLNIFIWKRTLGWLRSLHGVLHAKWVTIFFTIIHVLLAVSPAAYALFSNDAAKAAVKYISNIWIGVFIYALFFMVLSLLGTFVYRRVKKIKRGDPVRRRLVAARGAAVAVLILGFSAYGMIHVGTIKTSTYDITVHKACASGDRLKIVLVADMHMGYSIGKKQMAEMAEKINAQKPDLVCIAGDIFDNDYSALQNPERLMEIYRSIKSKYGVYACYGNHDVAENLVGGFTVPFGGKTINENEMNDFLRKSNVKLLQDQTELVDQAFYLIGRRDASKPGTESASRKSIEELLAGVDQRKPVLLLDHQPKELQEIADAGVDVDLSGHTHDGQIFPGNLTIRMMWENACGYLKKGDMHSIVTSGVGIWGPAMRVGTDSEIAVINITFDNRTAE